MQVTVGTFNLNHLFSPWNFRGAIQVIQQGGPGADVSVSYTFTELACCLVLNLSMLTVENRFTI